LRPSGRRAIQRIGDELHAAGTCTPKSFVSCQKQDQTSSIDFLEGSFERDAASFILRLVRCSMKLRIYLM
jgi:hypothetical protein